MRSTCHAFFSCILQRHINTPSSFFGLVVVNPFTTHKEVLAEHFTRSSDAHASNTRVGIDYERCVPNKHSRGVTSDVSIGSPRMSLTKRKKRTRSSIGGSVSATLEWRKCCAANTLLPSYKQAYNERPAQISSIAFLDGDMRMCPLLYCLLRIHYHCSA